MATLAGEAAIRIVPTTRGFKAEADRRLKEMRFEPIKVRIDPGFKEADAQMDEWRARQRLNAVNVPVKADFQAFKRDLTQVEHIFKRNALSQAVRINVKVIGLDALPALAYAAGSAASGLDALAESALALPGILGGAVSSVAALAIGVQGISKAWTAFTQDSTKAAQQSRELDKANRDVGRSYKDYTSAVRDTVRSIQDLNAENRRSSLNVADAVLSVQEAADKLRQGGQRSILELKRDQLSYLQSIDHLQDVQTKAQRTAQDAQRANADGVSNADAVVAALDRIADAQDQIANKGAATDSLATSLGKLAPNARAAFEAVTAFKSEYQDLQQLDQNNLFANLDAAITNLGTKSLPMLKRGLGDVSTGLNANIKNLLDSLASDKNQNLFARIFGDTSGGLQNLAKGVDPLTNAFARLTKESSDFLPRLGTAADKVFSRFDAWVNKVADNGSLDKWIDNGLKAVDNLGTTVGNVFSIFNSIGNAFDEASGHTGGFVKTIADLTTKIKDDLLSPQGFRRLVDYFGQAKEFVGNIKSSFQQMKPFIHDVVQVARDWSQTMFSVAGSFLQVAGFIERNTGLVGDLLKVYLTFKTVKPLVDGLTTSWKNYNKVVEAAASTKSPFRNLTGVQATQRSLQRMRGEYVETANQMRRTARAAEETQRAMGGPVLGPAAGGGAALKELESRRPAQLLPAGLKSSEILAYQASLRGGAALPPDLAKRIYDYQNALVESATAADHLADESRKAAGPVTAVGNASEVTGRKVEASAAEMQAAGTKVQTAGRQAGNAAREVESVGAAAVPAGNRLEEAGRKANESGNLIGNKGNAGSMLSRVAGLAGALIGPVGLTFAITGAMALVEKLGEAHRNAARDAKAQDDALKNLTSTLNGVTGGFNADSLTATLGQYKQATPIPAVDPNFIPFDAMQRLGLDPRSTTITAAAPNQSAQFDKDQNDRYAQLAKQIEDTSLYKSRKSVFDSYGIDSLTLAKAGAGEPDALSKVNDAVSKQKILAADPDSGQVNLPDLGAIANALPNKDLFGLTQVLRNTHAQNASAGANNLAVSQTTGGKRVLGGPASAALGQFGIDTNSLTTSPSGEGQIQINQNPGPDVEKSLGDQFGLTFSQPDPTGVITVTIPPEITADWLPALPGHKDGGLIRGPGTGTSDSILARVSQGEHIARAKAVDYYGSGLFDDLNSMRIPRESIPGFAPGGWPQDPPPGVPGPANPFTNLFGGLLGGVTGADPSTLTGILAPQAPLAPPAVTTPAVTPPVTAGASTGATGGGADHLSGPSTAPGPDSVGHNAAPVIPQAAGVASLTLPGGGQIQLDLSGNGALPDSKSSARSAVPNAPIIPNANILSYEAQVGQQFGLAVGSGADTNHGGTHSPDGAQHSFNRATDLGNAEQAKGGQVSAFVQAWMSDPTKVAATRQLIFRGPEGDYGIINGRILGPGEVENVYGGDLPGHTDHVHLALEGVPANALGGALLPGGVSATGGIGFGLGTSGLSLLGGGKGGKKESLQDFLGSQASNVGSTLLSVGTEFLSGITGLNFGDILGPGQKIGNFILSKLGGGQDQAAADIADQGMSDYSNGVGGISPALQNLLAANGISFDPSSLSPGGTASGGVDGSGGQAPAGGGGSSATRNAVYKAFKEAGFKESDWDSLDKLLQGESSWNPTIKNPQSGAFGLFQFLGHENDKYAAGYSSDPYQQAVVGMQYIKDTYGTPTNAYNKWLSRSPHWYANGGSTGNGVAWLSNGEYRTNPAATKYYGAGLFDALNNMAIPRRAGGGFIGDGAGYRPPVPVSTNLFGGFTPPAAGLASTSGTASTRSAGATAAAARYRGDGPANPALANAANSVVGGVAEEAVGAAKGLASTIAHPVDSLNALAPLLPTSMIPGAPGQQSPSQYGQNLTIFGKGLIHYDDFASGNGFAAAGKSLFDIASIPLGGAAGKFAKTRIADAIPEAHAATTGIDALGNNGRAALAANPGQTLADLRAAGVLPPDPANDIGAFRRFFDVGDLFDKRAAMEDTYPWKKGGLGSPYSRAQEHELHDYTGGSGKFNKPLWGGQRPFADTRQRIDDLTGAIDAAPRTPQDMILFHHFNEDALTSLGVDLSQGTLADRLKQYIGQVLVKPDFTSTSIQPKTGFGNIQMRIHVPAGSRAAYVSTHDDASSLSYYGKAEEEAILQRGRRYAFDHAEMNPDTGRPTIYARLLNGDEGGPDLGTFGHGVTETYKGNAHGGAGTSWMAGHTPGGSSSISGAAQTAGKHHASPHGGSPYAANLPDIQKLSFSKGTYKGVPIPVGISGNDYAAFKVGIDHAQSGGANLLSLEEALDKIDPDIGNKLTEFYANVGYKLAGGDKTKKLPFDENLPSTHSVIDGKVVANTGGVAANSPAALAQKQILDTLNSGGQLDPDLLNEDGGILWPGTTPPPGYKWSGNPGYIEKSPWGFPDSLPKPPPGLKMNAFNMDMWDWPLPGEDGYANGGLIRGIGTGTSDSNRIRASRGEFMMKHDAVNKYGLDFMNAVNTGHFWDGGWPLQPPAAAPGVGNGPLPGPPPPPAPAGPPPPALAPPAVHDPAQGVATNGIPSTGGAPGPGATAPAPDPGATPQVADALKGLGQAIGAGGGGVDGGPQGGQPGADPSNQGDPRATLGAGPASNDHLNPALSAGVKGAFNQAGAIGSAAAGAFGGGAASSLIAGGAQIAGSVATGALNILSSLLVGTATSGSTASASGVPLLPQRQGDQGVPNIVPQQVNNQTYNISSMHELSRLQEQVAAQNAMPFIGKYG